MKKRNTKKPKNYLSGITELERVLKGKDKTGDFGSELFNEIWGKGNKNNKGTVK